MVRTALDSNLQHYADHEVETELRQYGRDYGASQAAVVIADLDGGVRAMVGGRDYGASQFNRATDALRQPGSSFKPYVYATALANGFKPTSVIVDSPVCIGNWCPHNYSGGYSGSVTLIEAITHSINVIPVKLSIELGHGNPKARPRHDRADRAQFRHPVAAAGHAVAADRRRRGLCLPARRRLRDLPQSRQAVVPHAALEVRTGTGQLVWRFDRDGKKPQQVIAPSVALDMIKMMNSVVENGTGQRAKLDGIPVCGKTGTTNAWRDAWFVGYTGNFVGAVWMGNDDYTSTKRMTGGTLPAMTWHNIMAYAHQGIELRPLPGLSPPHACAAAGRSDVQRQRRAASGAADAQGNRALVQIERLLDDANHALAAQSAPPERSARSTTTRPRPSTWRRRPIATPPAGRAATSA